MFSVEETSDLNYHLREEGIHEFVFLNPTREAVDNLFATVAKIVADGPKFPTNAALIDVSRTPTLPPLTYMTQQAREFERRFQPAGHTRTAVIYSSAAMIHMVETFLNLLPSVRTGRMEVRFFRREHYAEAIDWLGSNQPSERRH